MPSIGAAKLFLSQSVVIPTLGNRLYSWGINGSGQLGIGNIITTSSPVQVGSGTDWTAAAGGVTTSSSNGWFLGIYNGMLFACGDNSEGQQGGVPGGEYTPVRIGTGTNWTAISASYYQSAGIAGGALYAWGNIPFGGVQSVPTQIGSGTNWTAITCGQEYFLGIAGGALYAWGYNNGTGCLGTGDILDYSVPTQIGTGTNWTTVAVGDYISYGIAGGVLYAWGLNNDGSIGDGTTGNSYSSPVQVGSGTNWTAVAGGGNGQSYGINNGALYAWGDNESGWLGLGISDFKVSVPTQVGSGTNWTAVSSILESSYGIAGGALYSWGDNEYGEVGIGTYPPPTFYSSPVQVGSGTNWTILSTGSLVNSVYAITHT